MNKAKQDTLLGIVFFTGLGLALWATFALTDLSFNGRRPRVDVFASNAGRIRAGDPVFVLGNRVGQVSFVEYLREETDAERRVRLELDLRRDIQLQSDAQIEIAAPSLLGGKIIEIDPGISRDPWPEGVPLIARLQSNGLDALGELLDDPQLKDDFTSAIAGIRQAVDQLNSTNGTLGLLINSTDLHDEFLEATRSAGRSLAELERAQSPLGRLIYSEEDGERLSSAIARIDSVATSIDEGQGVLGRLVNDTELGADIDRLLTDAADIVTDAKNGKGTIGRLLRDDGLADRVDGMITNFSELAANANNPEAGLIGALVADPELAAKGRKFISDLEAIGESLRSGKGMLARLINDEEMGEQLSRVLNQVSRAIEDAREAAPIGTFFQVVTGAF